eukprot:PhF_6_TR10266/c1_g2_i1/m.15914
MGCCHSRPVDLTRVSNSNTVGMALSPPHYSTPSATSTTTTSSFNDLFVVVQPSVVDDNASCPSSNSSGWASLFQTHTPPTNTKASTSSSQDSLFVTKADNRMVEGCVMNIDADQPNSNVPPPHGGVHPPQGNNIHHTMKSSVLVKLQQPRPSL